MIEERALMHKMVKNSSLMRNSQPRLRNDALRRCGEKHSSRSIGPPLQPPGFPRRSVQVLLRSPNGAGVRHERKRLNRSRKTAMLLFEGYISASNLAAGSVARW